MPNAAHEVLAAWSRRFPAFTLITQNVDGLHERAGTEPVLRMHGSIWDVGCWNAVRRVPAPLAGRDGAVSGAAADRVVTAAARCGPAWCGSASRWTPTSWTPASKPTRCDVFFTIGTSAIVYPAAGLVDHARRHGAVTVEINPESTPASAGVDIAIAQPAEMALPIIERRLKGEGSR